MLHYYKNYHRLTQGISLLEVMLSSALAVLIISALTNLYIKLNHAVLRNEEYITTSLTAARLISLFRSEVESAGHIGCAQLNEDFIVQPYQKYSITKANSLQVHDNELIVQYQAMPTLSLISPLNQHRTLLTDNGATVEPKDILLISDCNHAEIFQVKSINIKNNVKHITSIGQLRSAYGVNAEVGRLIYHRYFLQHHGARSDLIMEDSSGRNNILQTDVTDLQFQFDGGGVAYSFNYNNSIWSAYASTT